MPFPSPHPTAFFLRYSSSSSSTFVCYSMGLRLSSCTLQAMEWNAQRRVAVHSSPLPVSLSAPLDLVDQFKPRAGPDLGHPGPEPGPALTRLARPTMKNGNNLFSNHCSHLILFFTSKKVDTIFCHIFWMKYYCFYYNTTTLLLLR